MERGNLVIYDLKGTIFNQSGDAAGDVLPHELPEGVPYLIIPFGSATGKKVTSINVENEVHEPVFEEIVKEVTAETQLLIDAAVKEALEAAGVIANE